MENKQEPTYSIMIMSNDNRPLLRDCLDRIKANTPFEYELVVVDDASEPAYTKEEYPEIDVLVRMPKRSDCCTLRNVGMTMSSGEFVFWLDNDTMVSPGWYQPLIDTMKEGVGLTGQPKDGRMVRNPFLPLTQSDCMIEYQFAYDYNHFTRECDFIVSYCVLVRKAAFRPIHCWDMPTPCVDPELGIGVKSMGYKVMVAKSECAVSHMGSQTPRPGGRGYLYTLSRNFTRWYKFWESRKEELFLLYGDEPVKYAHNAQEPTREGSRDKHGDFDLEPE